MRSSSLTILLIVLLMFIIVLALIVIIGLTVMVNTGGGPDTESNAIFQFVSWSQEILGGIFTYMLGWTEYFISQIEKLSSMF
ncbi:MAG: hypothetical protein LUQ01_02750 [Methanolinea sp.]|nr:hypothetical protein [Methanolinea sp.]